MNTAHGDHNSAKASFPCLEAAQDYLKRGWSPLALCPADHVGVDAAHERTCAAPGSTPLWPWTEYQRRLPSERVLSIYWNRNPRANVGIALGPVSGLVAIQCDGPAADALPETLEVDDPGGRQLLYGYADQIHVPSGKVQVPDGDREVRFLGTGSCAVFPPSRHVNGGAYEWRPGHGPGERTPAPLPGWIVDALAASQASAPPALRRTPETIATVPPQVSGDKGPVPHIVMLEEVTACATHWLWPGRIPLGKLTVLDGDPGLGKSTLLLDLAARVSRGLAMPDGAAAPCGGVTLLTAEDGLGDTVRPRLEAAGADLARVRAFSAIGEQDGGSRPPAIPRDLEMLRRILIENDSRLLIIDPFLAYLAGGIDSCNDQDIRRCLHRLADLAETTRCAVVLLRHLNKLSGGKAIYRGAGSIGIIGAARSGLLVARDPDSEQQRVLACTKSNLTAMPASLRFALQAADQGVCRITWHGTSPLQADELIGPTEPVEARGIVNDATRFLQTLLADGPVSAQECLRQARAAGITEITLRRAKGRLGVQSLREGEGLVGHWLWQLPRSQSP